MKGLEALKRIERDMEYVTRLDFVEPIVRGEVQQELYKIYHREEKDLSIIENELKALEIIKKKNFDLYYLQDSKDLEMYNDICDHYRNLCYLTQEEYDLLKEVLIDDAL